MPVIPVMVETGALLEPRQTGKPQGQRKKKKRKIIKHGNGCAHL